MKHTLAITLFVSACAGHSTDDAWTLTPLDPVREAWGSTGGVLVPPTSDDAEWCGVVAVESPERETLAPLGQPELGASCVVLMPGEHVAFYTRDGGADYLARQEHDRVSSDGTCPLRCEP